MATTTPGPSQPISLSGNTVGVLDPTQPQRLLSSLGSTLSFATFHPRTASQNPRKLSRGDELCSNKRVVIETLPSGESFWRWVPRAKGVENGGAEGEWPRLVDICGQHVLCSQEQWDIHKLDSEYECTIHPAPLLSTITRRRAADKPAADGGSGSRQSGSKRAYVEDSSDEDLPMPEVEVQEDSDDEVEMIVDNTVQSAASRAHRKKMQETREERRQKLSAKTRKQHHDDVGDLSMIDLTIEPSPPLYSEPSSSSQPPSHTSNPPSFASEPPSYTSNGFTSASHASYTTRDRPTETKNASPGAFHAHSKRRTSSPQSHLPSKRARRVAPEFAQKKLARAQLRNNHYQERVQRGRDTRDKYFMQTLRATVPPGTYEFSEPTSNASTQATTPQPELAPDEDPISLEEKIRRIQEMNAYEQARYERDEARRRAEAAEAEQRRKQEEKQRRERERFERECLEREREEARRRAQQEENERRRRQFQEEQDRRWQQQQQERFSHGPWTSQRALERYKSLADAFDSAKFTAEDPVTFATVPWPVLHKPTRFTVEDVDWSSVEAFFHAVRSHMRSQDYKTFVEKSHRRFHPDRWRARRVLQSIEDDELRACLEVAANTVAQAITPLWKAIKG
ncbi:hypothetical protein PHLGIDRAFT_184256 [Phlebiopsis gigantea 11061_1 CR5-6]|uniref:Uncharacterized protein n=1 Tax=Phlebiopsis gigantea (strain 11061_1 CR5-6) TaxID=745531 RepID=A0A0C3NZK2_PHLG1|nr:hypothetical protein PHLGIDRAFT_184256 [Phlebiopsis gigantea 11061_1 CR5-6]